MGFTVTPLAQKARTATLIADSDLNLGNYDLIATDVKGDTAEFDEFVGGVGNFSNVLGSGNLDIEGTGNIKGLTTFQNAVQVNGALHVEGSINNVNIADNGEITTAQGVNGADFNGAKITATKFNGATIDTSGNVTGAKGSFSGAVTGTTGTFSGAVTGTMFNNVSIKGSGVYTVTPLSTKHYIPLLDTTATLLPMCSGVLYTGSLKFYADTGTVTINYWDGTTKNLHTLSVSTSGTSLTFSNIAYLVVGAVQSSSTSACKVSGFKLS